MTNGRRPNAPPIGCGLHCPGLPHQLVNCCSPSGALMARHICSVQYPCRQGCHAEIRRCQAYDSYWQMSIPRKFRYVRPKMSLWPACLLQGAMPARLAGQQAPPAAAPQAQTAGTPLPCCGTGQGEPRGRPHRCGRCGSCTAKQGRGRGAMVGSCVGTAPQLNPALHCDASPPAPVKHPEAAEVGGIYRQGRIASAHERKEVGQRQVCPLPPRQQRRHLLQQWLVAVLHGRAAATQTRPGGQGQARSDETGSRWGQLSTLGASLACGRSCCAVLGRGKPA